MTPDPVSPGPLAWIILAALLTFAGAVVGVVAAAGWWLDRRRRRQPRDREMAQAWARFERDHGHEFEEPARPGPDDDLSAS